MLIKLNIITKHQNYDVKQSNTAKVGRAIIGKEKTEYDMIHIVFQVTESFHDLRAVFASISPPKKNMLPSKIF